MLKIKSEKNNYFVSLNSLVYFLLAYFVVIFSINLFSILLGVVNGFNAQLFYYGYFFSGKEWSNQNIFSVFFFGNSLSLLFAILAERLYKEKRKYASSFKLFYLWVYIISISFFLGNFIVGAFFDFGIGSALIALNIPFIIRLVFAILSVIALLNLGYYSQKHIQISANVYFIKISNDLLPDFFVKQIVIPSLLGIIFIILFKIPYLGMYNYLDLLVLLPIFLFVGGTFIRIKYLHSMKFKRKTNSMKLSIIPIFILIIFILVLKIGLKNGLNF